MNRPKSIPEMKQERQEKLTVQRAMLDKIDSQARGFTEDEDKRYKLLETEIDKMDSDIIAAEADLERRRALAEREIGRKHGRLDTDPSKEFRAIGETFFSIARLQKDGVRDERLDRLYEKREMQMGTGSAGGYALPEQFDATLRQVQAQGAVVRPRTTVLPAGSPPDAKLTMPSLDQTAGENIYGGVQITHTGEGQTMVETDLALREVSLEPKELTAYIIVTDKLLANWESAGITITRQLAAAMVGAEDYDFIRGNGVNRALGFINSPAAVCHTRAGAGAIAFSDVYNMLARILMREGSPYVWLASQTTVPQLAAMVDAGNHSVWFGGGNLPGAAGSIPSTLLGLPVIFSDRCPALGSKGDLSLVNLSYYLVKDGSGPAIASSPHVYFLSNKTVFRIVWRVDGHPWLTEPLALEGSTANTVSPFVVLE